MRETAAAILMMLVLGVGVADAQNRGAEVLEAPDVRGLAGPGTISASPMRSVQSGSAPAAGAPKRNTGAVARPFGTGTPMGYGQGGANALGDTGGMTTGVYGSAGVVAGGGSVGSRQLVIAPAPIDGAMHGDEMHEPPTATHRMQRAEQH